MSDLDETHDANQTSRSAESFQSDTRNHSSLTANNGHTTADSGHTRSKYGDARQDWLDTLTTSEADAYRQGRREAALEHQKYVRAYLSYRRVLTKIARGEATNPAASARFILSTLGDDE